MRVFLLGLIFSLLIAVPASASTPEVNALIAPIESYQQKVTALAENPDSPESKAMQARMQRFSKCAKAFLKSPKLRKKLKTKQGKNFVASLFVLNLSETISAGYNVYSPEMLAAADELDSLTLSDQTLLANAKAGAAFTRDSVEFYRETGNGSWGCRYLKRVAGLSQWTSSRLEAAFLAAAPRTAEQQKLIGARLDENQAVLQKGYTYLKSLDTSEAQLELFSGFFSVGDASESKASLGVHPAG